MKSPPFLACAALVLSMTAAGAFAQTQGTTAPPAPDIRGQWRSVAPENYGNHYATRAFTVADGQWQVRYQAYADAQGRQPLFTIRVQGWYVLGEPSQKVPGAHEGNFPARTRSLTADSESGVQMFASMGCALQPGQEKFLVNTGCGFVPGVMQVMGEYDLAALRDGQLFFGDRASDLSKARPDRLTPHPLARQP